MALARHSADYYNHDGHFVLVIGSFANREIKGSFFLRHRYTELFKSLTEP